MLNGVDQALGRAIGFLQRQQLPDGQLPADAWRPGHDARDPAVFPTAVAAHSLSFAPGADDVRQRALDFLQRESDPRGLWRHWPREHPQHELIPPDLDDTACASAALERGDREFPGNRATLRANRDSRGLFLTWKIGVPELRHPLALYLFFRRTSASLRDVDAVVNANVLFYLGLDPHTRPAADLLLDVLREDREQTCDKWYDNRFVVWYFFSRALHSCAPEAGELIRRKLAAASPANPFETALAACTLQDWGERPSIEPLLRSQLSSGGWPRTALYTGGRARRRDGTFQLQHPDTPKWGSEAVTTAFCIEALSRWSGAG